MSEEHIVMTMTSSEATPSNEIGKCIWKLNGWNNGTKDIMKSLAGCIVEVGKEAESRIRLRFFLKEHRQTKNEGNGHGHQREYHWLSLCATVQAKTCEPLAFYAEVSGSTSFFRGFGVKTMEERECQVLRDDFILLRSRVLNMGASACLGRGRFSSNSPHHKFHRSFDEEPKNPIDLEYTITVTRFNFKGMSLLPILQNLRVETNKTEGVSCQPSR